MAMLILNESEVRAAVDKVDAVAAMEHAFTMLADGKALLPDVINLEIPQRNGEFHIKGAYLDGSDDVAFKAAISFYDNPAQGLPSSSGLFFLFDSHTGVPKALMLDNSLLTHVRTGAAGAVAAKYLARERIDQALVVGCGTQSRFQIKYLLTVRDVGRIKLYDQAPEAAETLREELAGTAGLDVSTTRSLADEVPGSDYVVTVTPSHKPLIMADWVRPGTQVTAVGTDSAEKQELDEALFAKADVIVVDRLSQCVRLGDLHHAVDGDVIAVDDVAGELGDVVTGRVPGRSGDAQITLADLTGVGVQDAAIASPVLARAVEMGLGRRIET